MATVIYPTLYRQLLERFGPQNWWPGDSPWEVAVGAMLTQNTNWRNVERAIARLKAADALEIGKILDMPRPGLAELIRPSGYFNVKAGRLRNLAVWWRANAEWAATPSTALATARDSLLTVNGVGEETADSILLYAFQRPAFVVDAYTRTMVSRHQLMRSDASYGDIQARFEKCLPRDAAIYNEYHALIVALGKSYCRPTPICSECPLRWHLNHGIEPD